MLKAQKSNETNGFKKKKKNKQDQTGQRTTTIQLYNIMKMDAFDIIKS